MIRDAPDGVVIDIKVVPRAGKTAIAGTRDNALLIRLAAAPVEGAANEALVTLLAEVFQVSKRQIVLVSGEKSRRKTVKVTGLTADLARARLGRDERQ